MIIPFFISDDFRKTEENTGRLLLNFLKATEVKRFLQISGNETDNAITSIFNTQKIVPIPTTTPVLVPEPEANITKDWIAKLITILIKPLKKFDAVTSNNKLSADVLAIAKLHQTTTATARTSMILEAETTVTPETLKNLIAAEVKRATKAQAKEISSLKTQLKKDQRGAPTSASSKKKQTAATKDEPKDTTTPASTNQARNGTGKGKNTRKAAGSNKDTTVEKQASRRNGKGKKSNKQRTTKKN